MDDSIGDVFDLKASERFNLTYFMGGEVKGDELVFK
jgi:hypothetical protein